MMVRVCLERVLNSSIAIFREGGLHGWIAVFGLFTAKIAWSVLVKGMGMMLPTLQEQFDTSTWLIGWMVAFVSAGFEILGKLGLILGLRHGGRSFLGNTLISLVLLHVLMLVSIQSTDSVLQKIIKMSRN